MVDTPHSGETLVAAGILPIAPGVYLSRFVLQKFGDTPEAAAKKMGVSLWELAAVLGDRQPITQSFAQLLAAYAKTTTGFWLSKQAAWDYAQEAVPKAARGDFWSVTDP